MPEKHAGAEMEKTEAALRRANDIISRSPAVAFIWKNAEDWPVEYVSDNVHTIFGWHQSDFVSGAVLYAQVVYPEDLPRVQQEVLHASIDPATMKFQHRPYRIIARDGAVKWVDDYTTILRNEDGGVAAYEGILLDITDRKLVEQRLNLIQFSMDQAAEGILWMDADGRVIYANDTECKRLGYSREELSRLSTFDIDPSVTPENWLEKWETLRRAGTITFETQHRTKTGELVPVELSSKFIEFNEKEFCFSTSRDITKRKRAEAALEKRLTVLTRPLDNAEDISFEELFDLENIQRLQDQFAEATGVASIITRTDGSPITRPSNFCRLCNDIIRGTEKGRNNCYKSDAVLGQVRLDGPVIQPCMSSGLWDAGAGITVGGHHIANWLIGQVRDETQTDENMLAYAREIGADEEAFIKAFHEVPAMSKERFTAVARALFTLADQLSTMAYQNIRQARSITERERAEREKESLQEKFQQVQKLESVGRLAGGVALDLNNLLVPILGHCEMLLDVLGIDDMCRGSVQSIMEAGDRARDIVRHLLAFSRKQTMEIKSIEINEMLTRFQDLLKRTVREDIQVRVTFAPFQSRIMGDIGQLEQMIMNLAVNAQDAMPDGGLLALEAALVTLGDEDQADSRDLEPGTYVMLAISDTGYGVDEEIRKYIFEPFFSTKGVHGKGLGLATAYGIVKQHGGGIWLYSEPGEGTTVKIYLPASDAAAVEETATEPVETLRGFETILLAEDDDQTLKLAADILSSRGYHVLEAENGKKALELLETHAAAVEMLLTDLFMPDMNGRELSAKAAEILPGIRVLYMSGYTGDMIAQRGVLEADVNFIQKPFSVRGLTKKVREVLDQG